MASTTKSNALAMTLTIRVPVLTRYEEEMDYERFCEEYMSPEEDEDSPTLEKRCRETWEALVELYEKDGFVELEEIDGGELTENVLENYAEAEEAFQGIVDEAIDDLKKTRDWEARREEMNALAKANAEKRRAEREQARKDAEEFALWKKEKQERDAEKQAMVERMAELEERVKELTFGV